VKEKKQRKASLHSLLMRKLRAFELLLFSSLPGVHQKKYFLVGQLVQWSAV